MVADKLENAAQQGVFEREEKATKLKSNNDTVL